MSDAKKCDRCGKFYTIVSEDYNKRPSHAGKSIFRVRTIGIDEQIWLKTYDLCIDCANELNEFLNGPKRGDYE